MAAGEEAEEADRAGAKAGGRLWKGPVVPLTMRQRLGRRVWWFGGRRGGLRGRREEVQGVRGLGWQSLGGS